MFRKGWTEPDGHSGRLDLGEALGHMGVKSSPGRVWGLWWQSLNEDTTCEIQTITV